MHLALAFMFGSLSTLGIERIWRKFRDDIEEDADKLYGPRWKG